MESSLEAAKNCLKDDLYEWFHKVNKHRARISLPPLIADLDGIVSLFGREKLLSEYDRIISSFFATPFDDEQTIDQFTEPVTNAEIDRAFQLAGLAEPDATKVNFKDFFKLKLVSEITSANFGLKIFVYDVKIAPLPFSFDNATSLDLLPKLFRELFNQCTWSFFPTDRIIVEIGNDALASPFNLHLSKFSDFDPDNLLRRVQLMNSSKSFSLDDSFKIKITQIRIPAGGARATNVHCKYDRARMSLSLVTVCVSNNLCLPAALFLGAFRLEHDVTKIPHKSQWINLIRKDRPNAREREAMSLVQRAGLTPGSMFNLDDIEKFQLTCFQNFQICVLSASHANAVIFQYPAVRSAGMKNIYLLLDRNHFDLITNPRGFLGSSFFCDDCKKAFRRREDHRCDGVCGSCYRANDICVNTKPQKCDECLRYFRNDGCFAAHKQIRPKRQKSYCQDVFVCKRCNVFVSLLRRKTSAVHTCGEIHCRVCKGYFPQKSHQCFVQKLDPPTVKDVPKFIFFDFETFVDPVHGHTPNLVVAVTWDGRDVVFPTPGAPMQGDVTTQFCQWLFSEQHRGATLIAHNLRGFDGYFILRWLIDNNRKISVIKRGSQLLEMKYATLDMKTRDTLNFCALRLADFPKAVGLEEGVIKGDFPHLANVKENWDKVIPFPGPELYGIESMKKKQRDEFLLWHAEEKERCGGFFDFRAQIVKYCKKDVEVLQKSAMKFRSDFISTTKIDPFDSITIQGACQKYFKSFLMNENEIAVISANGYQANRKTSIEATEWLEWKKIQYPNLRHGRNGKEVKIGRYFVDGYDDESKTVFEYNGDVFHGCPEHTEQTDKVPFSHITMAEALSYHKEKVQFIETCGYKVEVMWSCQWRHLRQVEEEIGAFLFLLNLHDPLKPKDAFKGGRTNGFKLFEKIKPGQIISHIDVVSLYPYVNKHCEYPVGHPELIVSDFDDVRNYFGFVRCVVDCPSEDYFPILPVTINQKLMFPLCQTCAKTCQQTPCEHKYGARYLKGTWTTAELHYAINNGYRIVEIFEVWHWKERRVGLFADYVDTFLKIKVEASGWPNWCVTEEDKDNFVRQMKDQEGIDIDKSKVATNEGLRRVAKEMLNGFWGKYGQSDELSKTSFVYDPKKFFDRVRSKSEKITDIHMMTENCVMLTSVVEPEYNEGNSNGNLAIAAFTTSWARLKLLEMLRKLGKRVLYCDTDSVMFLTNPGDWEPELGNVLGMWSSELKPGEKHIVKFVCLGPKCYAYETDTGRQEVKSKSFTQNGFTEDILEWSQDGEHLIRSGKTMDFENMYNLLQNPGTKLQVIYPSFMKRNFKEQKIKNVLLAKQMRLVYDKRMLLDDFTTLPFGTRATVQ